MYIAFPSGEDKKSPFIFPRSDMTLRMYEYSMAYSNDRHVCLTSLLAKRGIWFWTFMTSKSEQSLHRKQKYSHFFTTRKKLSHFLGYRPGYIGGIFRWGLCKAIWWKPRSYAMSYFSAMWILCNVAIILTLLISNFIFVLEFFTNILTIILVNFTCVSCG